MYPFGARVAEEVLKIRRNEDGKCHRRDYQGQSAAVWTDLHPTTSARRANVAPLRRARLALPALLTLD